MNDIYGPIQKSPLSILFFLVPAVVIVGIAIGLVVMDGGSLFDVASNAVFQICAGLAAALLIWGVVFISKPIVTLTPDALVLPRGKAVSWSTVTKVEEGQTSTTAASANTGARTVVHEVVRIFHDENDVTKIVTTWAALGPQSANDRIIAGFDASR